MKKIFSLHDPRKADARVVDAIKHEVRKYVRRELKKLTPDGAKRRTFVCFVGPNQTEARVTTLKEVSAAIDRVAQAGGDQVFIQIKAAPAEESAR